MRLTLGIGGARQAIATGDRRVPVSAPGGRTALGVGLVREPLDLATAMRATVGVGPQLDAAPPPQLLSCNLSASAGQTRVSVTLIYWTPNGRIRFSCRRTSDNVRFGISSYSVTGTYQPALLCTGLTIGTQYELDYWLDCIPNVPGYTETWYATGLIWTQPAAGGGDIDFHYGA